MLASEIFATLVFGKVAAEHFRVVLLRSKSGAPPHSAFVHIGGKGGGFLAVLI